MNEMFLPDWATGKLNGEYIVVGAQLLTRDGRRSGNAYVHEIDIDEQFNELAIVYTDMGTRLKFTLKELKELYHPPMYKMNIQEAYEKRVQKNFQDLINDDLVYGFNVHSSKYLSKEERLRNILKTVQAGDMEIDSAVELIKRIWR